MDSYKKKAGKSKSDKSILNKIRKKKNNVSLQFTRQLATTSHTFVDRDPIADATVLEKPNPDVSNQHGLFNRSITPLDDPANKVKTVDLRGKSATPTFHFIQPVVEVLVIPAEVPDDPESKLDSESQRKLDEQKRLKDEEDEAKRNELKQKNESTQDETLDDSNNAKKNNKNNNNDGNDPEQSPTNSTVNLIDSKLDPTENSLFKRKLMLGIGIGVAAVLVLLVGGVVGAVLAMGTRIFCVIKKKRIYFEKCSVIGTRIAW